MSKLDGDENADVKKEVLRAIENASDIYIIRNGARRRRFEG
jgi:hypothetical protein